MDAYARIHSERGGEVVAERLGNINCPLLVVHGDKDAMVDPAHPEHMRKHIRGARLHRCCCREEPHSYLYTYTRVWYYSETLGSRFPDGKHNLHLKYAKEFNKLVTDFFLE